jgi:hypothetical protein
MDQLTTASHAVVVRATDAVGNVEAPGASATWTTVALPVPVETPPTAPVPAPADPPTPTTPTTPPTPPTPPTIPAADLPPTVALAPALAGTTFTKTLNVAATATDDQKVDRVEFWLDGQRMGTDRRAPYQVSWTAPSALSYGAHTVTARAFDANGAASSAAATITRVHRQQSRASRASGWRMTSAPVAEHGTSLTGRGSGSKSVTVTMTRCDDASGTPVATVRARSTSSGGVTALATSPGLCVLGVR